jgi:hypothetical protein
MVPLIILKSITLWYPVLAVARYKPFGETATETGKLELEEREDVSARIDRKVLSTLVYYEYIL